MTVQDIVLVHFIETAVEGRAGAIFLAINNAGLKSAVKLGIGHRSSGSAEGFQHLRIDGGLHRADLQARHISSAVDRLDIVREVAETAVVCGSQSLETKLRLDIRIDTLHIVAVEHRVELITVIKQIGNRHSLNRWIQRSRLTIAAHNALKGSLHALLQSFLRTAELAGRINLDRDAAAGVALTIILERKSACIDKVKRFESTVVILRCVATVDLQCVLFCCRRGHGHIGHHHHQSNEKCK